MSENETFKGYIEKVKIKELPQSNSINDNDMFVKSDGLETYKVTAGDIVLYIIQNEHLLNTYVKKSEIGIADGIAPLNSDSKINGVYITYGNAANTAYEGSSGKILEENMDNHLIDPDAHGYGTQLENIYSKLEVDEKLDHLSTDTAGSSNTSKKIFLIGAETQAPSAKTYSHSKVYVDSDGDLCSNNTKVSLDTHTHQEYVNIVYSDQPPTEQKDGDYWCQDY